MSPNSYSAWVRQVRGQSAHREAMPGCPVLRVQRIGESWAVSVGSEILGGVVPSAHTLDEVITALDAQYIPEGWALDEDGKWSREGWSCETADAGTYRVMRVQSSGERELACARTFASADRARAWVEVRLDRTHLQLRGPLPRNACRASAHLPDVRVTSEERERALQLAGRLGLSFSELLRASMVLLSDLYPADTDAPRLQVDRSKDREPRLILVENKLIEG